MSDTKNVKIPEAAVEAALSKLSLESAQLVGRVEMRAALEVASSHMLRTVTTLAELDALPEGCVVRSDLGVFYVKDQIRVGPTSWWVTTNEQHDFRSTDVDLPATVLREP